MGNSDFTFLVDLENVGKQGLKGCELLTANDKLILFESASTPNVSGLETEASVAHVHLINRGPNNLDLQIAVTVGHLIASEENRNIVIISRDAGFQYTASFASKEYRRKIQIADTIEHLLSPNNVLLRILDSDSSESLHDSLKNSYGELGKYVYAYLKKTLGKRYGKGWFAKFSDLTPTEKIRRVSNSLREGGSSFENTEELQEIKTALGQKPKRAVQKA